MGRIHVLGSSDFSVNFRDVEMSHTIFVHQTKTKRKKKVYEKTKIQRIIRHEYNILDNIVSFSQSKSHPQFAKLYMNNNSCCSCCVASHTHTQSNNVASPSPPPPQKMFMLETYNVYVSQPACKTKAIISFDLEWQTRMEYQ